MTNAERVGENNTVEAFLDLVGLLIARSHLSGTARREVEEASDGSSETDGAKAREIPRKQRASRGRQP